MGGLNHCDVCIAHPWKAADTLTVWVCAYLSHGLQSSFHTCTWSTWVLVEHKKTEFFRQTFLDIQVTTCHFIRYTFLVPRLDKFCLQNCLNFLWHRFNKVLERFLRDFGPFCHDRITHLCRFVVCEFPVPPHPNGALLDWDERMFRSVEEYDTCKTLVHKCIYSQIYISCFCVYSLVAYSIDFFQ